MPNFRKIFTIIPQDQEKLNYSLGPDIDSDEIYPGGADSDPYIVAESERTLREWITTIQEDDSHIINVHKMPSRYMERAIAIFKYIQEESIDSLGNLKDEVIHNARAALEALFENTAVYDILKTQTTYAAALLAVHLCKNVQDEFDQLVTQFTADLNTTRINAQKALNDFREIEDDAAINNHNLYEPNQASRFPDGPSNFPEQETVAFPTGAGPDEITKATWEVQRAKLDGEEVPKKPVPGDSPGDEEAAKKALIKTRAAAAPAAAPAAAAAAAPAPAAAAAPGAAAAAAPVAPGKRKKKKKKGLVSGFLDAVRGVKSEDEFADAAEVPEGAASGLKSGGSLKSITNMNRMFMKKAGRIMEKKIIRSRPQLKPTSYSISESVKIVPKIKNIISGVTGLNSFSTEIPEVGTESSRTLLEYQDNYEQENIRNYAEMFEKTSKDFSNILSYVNENQFSNLADTFGRVIAQVDDSVTELSMGELMEKKYGIYDVPLSQTNRQKHNQNSQLNAITRAERLHQMRNLTEQGFAKLTRATADAKNLWGHTTEDQYQDPMEVDFDNAKKFRENDQMINSAKSDMAKKLFQFIQYGSVNQGANSLYADIIDGDDAKNLIAAIAANKPDEAFGYDLFNYDGIENPDRLPVHAQFAILSKLFQEQSLVNAQDFLAFGDANQVLDELTAGEMKIHPRTLLGIAVNNMATDTVVADGKDLSLSNVPDNFLNIPFYWDTGFQMLARRSVTNQAATRMSVGALMRGRHKALSVAVLTSKARNPYDVGKDETQIQGDDPENLTEESLAVLESKALELGISDNSFDDAAFNDLTNDESEAKKEDNKIYEADRAFNDYQEAKFVEAVAEDREREEDLLSAADTLTDNQLEQSSGLPEESSAPTEGESDLPPADPALEGGSISANNQMGTYVAYKANILANIILENFMKVKRRFDFMNRPPTPMNKLAVQFGATVLLELVTPLNKISIPTNEKKEIPKAIRIAAVEIGYNNAFQIAQRSFVVKTDNRAIIRMAAKEMYRAQHRQYLLQRYGSRLETLSKLGGVPLLDHTNRVNSQSMAPFAVTSAAFTRNFQQEVDIGGRTVTHGAIIQNLQLISDKIMNELEELPDTVTKRKMQKAASVMLAHGGLNADFMQKLTAIGIATNSLGNIPSILKGLIGHHSNRGKMENVIREYARVYGIPGDTERIVDQILRQNEYYKDKNAPYKADWLNQPHLVRDRGPAMPIDEYRAPADPPPGPVVPAGPVPDIRIAPEDLDALRDIMREAAAAAPRDRRSRSRSSSWERGEGRFYGDAELPRMMRVAPDEEFKGLSGKIEAAISSGADKVSGEMASVNRILDNYFAGFVARDDESQRKLNLLMEATLKKVLEEVNVKVSMTGETPAPEVRAAMPVIPDAPGDYWGEMLGKLPGARGFWTDFLAKIPNANESLWGVILKKLPAADRYWWKSIKFPEIPADYWKDIPKPAFPDDFYKDLKAPPPPADFWKGVKLPEFGEDFWRALKVPPIPPTIWDALKPPNIPANIWAGISPPEIPRDLWDDLRPPPIPADLWATLKVPVIPVNLWDSLKPPQIPADIWKDLKPPEIPQDIWKSIKPPPIPDDIWNGIKVPQIPANLWKDLKIPPIPASIWDELKKAIPKAPEDFWGKPPKFPDNFWGKPPKFPDNFWGKPPDFPDDFWRRVKIPDVPDTFWNNAKPKSLPTGFWDDLRANIKPPDDWWDKIAAKAKVSDIKIPDTAFGNFKPPPQFWSDISNVMKEVASKFTPTVDRNTIDAAIKEGLKGVTINTRFEMGDNTAIKFAEKLAAKLPTKVDLPNEFFNELSTRLNTTVSEALARFTPPAAPVAAATPAGMPAPAPITITAENLAAKLKEPMDKSLELIKNMIQNDIKETTTARAARETNLNQYIREQKLIWDETVAKQKELTDNMLPALTALTETGKALKNDMLLSSADRQKMMTEFNNLLKLLQQMIEEKRKKKPEGEAMEVSSSGGPPQPPGGGPGAASAAISSFETVVSKTLKDLPLLTESNMDTLLTKFSKGIVDEIQKSNNEIINKGVYPEISKIVDKIKEITTITTGMHDNYKAALDTLAQSLNTSREHLQATFNSTQAHLQGTKELIDTSGAALQNQIASIKDIANRYDQSMVEANNKYNQVLKSSIETLGEQMTQQRRLEMNDLDRVWRARIESLENAIRGKKEEATVLASSSKPPPPGPGGERVAITSSSISGTTEEPVYYPNVRPSVNKPPPRPDTDDESGAARVRGRQITRIAKVRPEVTEADLEYARYEVASTISDSTSYARDRSPLSVSSIRSRSRAKLNPETAAKIRASNIDPEAKKSETTISRKRAITPSVAPSSKIKERLAESIMTDDEEEYYTSATEDEGVSSKTLKVVVPQTERGPSNITAQPQNNLEINKDKGYLINECCKDGKCLLHEAQQDTINRIVSKFKSKSEEADIVARPADERDKKTILGQKTIPDEDTLDPGEMSNIKEASARLTAKKELGYAIDGAATTTKTAETKESSEDAVVPQGNDKISSIGRDTVVGGPSPSATVPGVTDRDSTNPVESRSTITTDPDSQRRLFDFIERVQQFDLEKSKTGADTLVEALRQARPGTTPILTRREKKLANNEEGARDALEKALVSLVNDWNANSTQAGPVGLSAFAGYNLTGEQVRVIRKFLTFVSKYDKSVANGKLKAIVQPPTNQPPVPLPPPPPAGEEEQDTRGIALYQYGTNPHFDAAIEDSFSEMTNRYEWLGTDRPAISRNQASRAASELESNLATLMERVLRTVTVAERNPTWITWDEARLAITTLQIFVDEIANTTALNEFTRLQATLSTARAKLSGNIRILQRLKAKMEGNPLFGEKPFGAGIKRTDYKCAKCGDKKHSSLNDVADKEILCNKCIGKGMYSNRTRINDSDIKTPLLSHKKHGAAIREEQLNDARMREENSSGWEKFENSIPQKLISGNVEKRLISDYVAYGKANDHLLNLTTIAIGLATHKYDSNPPPMLMANIMGGLSKFAKTSKREHFINLDKLDNFSTLKQYVLRDAFNLISNITDQ